jgi:hypothetical protein
VIVTVADIARMTVPAVGYVGPVVVDDGTGMTTPFTVSPATRFAVNAPCLDVPVVASVPADAPFTVRCVLPFASPVTVCVLDWLTVLLLLSRLVAVPVTVTVVVAVFVVLSIFACVTPALVVYFETRVTTKPSRVVVGPHVTRPVVAEYTHVVPSS